MSFLLSSGAIGAIPDSDIYLQDDWGDNKLQNRDESGTTTYNGVTGVYRPEWTLDVGAAEATSQRLVLDGGDGVRTTINLDLTSQVTWTWDDINVDGNTGFGAFAETTTRADLSQSLNDGYWVQLNIANSQLRLLRNDSGSSTQLINAGVSFADGDTVTLTRSASGDWQLSLNGSTVGSTVTDTTYTTPEHIWFGKEDSSAGTTSLNEIKVN